jgi:hypothetical protein
MARKIGGVIAALAVWMIVVTVVGGVMRASWPAYAQVAEAMTFTLPMMLARLAIGAAATLAAGYVTAVITPSVIARLMPGVILLIAFIPIHIGLWEKFPIWYHLTFLLSLVPLTWVGAMAAVTGPVSSRSSSDGIRRGGTTPGQDHSQATSRASRA